MIANDAQLQEKYQRLSSEWHSWIDGGQAQVAMISNYSQELNIMVNTVRSAFRLYRNSAAELAKLEREMDRLRDFINNAISP
jgi:hypothetical protein